MHKRRVGLLLSASLLSISVALGGDQFDQPGTWDVYDSTGNVIGTMTSNNLGQFVDFTDDPLQNHPPNTDFSLCWLVPNPGDGMYDYIPATSYRIEFATVYKSVDGHKVIDYYTWTKWNYGTTPRTKVEEGKIRPH